MVFEREGIKVFVYREPIDMRAGFERLHDYCVHHMKARLNEGHVYVFFGRNRSRMKVLLYDGSGLVLIAKRLERKRFMLHEELLGRSELGLEEFRLIFHGSVVRGPIFGAEADRLDQLRLHRLMAIVRGEAKEISSTQREGFALPIGNQNAPL